MSRRAKLILLGAAALLLVAAANWHSLLFLYAGIADEKRPALLEGVPRDTPGADTAFRQRFAVGTSEKELTRWLRENDFAILSRQHRASLLVAKLPCNEEVEVSWMADDAGRLERAGAVIRRAGCKGDPRP